MDKEFILQEIRRTAASNDGRALGINTFEKETGIRPHEWQGKFWARWNDAVREAGVIPNELTKGLEESQIIESVIRLARELGRLPTKDEISLRSRSDPLLPQSKTILKRLGLRDERVAKIRNYCSGREGYEDILHFCDSAGIKQKSSRPEGKTKNEPYGYVYLLKSGRYYKIGFTNAVGRRERELAIQLPEKAATVHSIATDDPSGIEAYWHKRFESFRRNGEWFELGVDEVKVFRRRKFM